MERQCSVQVTGLVTGLAMTVALLLACAPAARADAEKMVLLESTLPPVAKQMVASLVEAAGRAGAPRLEVEDTDATGGEVAVGSGAYAVTAVPVNRLARHVRAADLFSLPFLFNTRDSQASILSRRGMVRQTFDTAALEFGIRIIALLPVGYEGLAFTDTIAARPDALAGMRVLADGPSDRGFVAATSGIPIRRGRHGSAVLAPWEVMAADGLYHGYYDLREAPSLIALVVNEVIWRNLSEAERSAWVSAAEDAEARAQGDLERLHETQLAGMSERGVDVVAVTASDREIWRAATAGLARASYLGESHKLGRAFLHAVDKMQSSRSPGNGDEPGNSD